MHHRAWNVQRQLALSAERSHEIACTRALAVRSMHNVKPTTFSSARGLKNFIISIVCCVIARRHQIVSLCLLSIIDGSLYVAHSHNQVNQRQTTSRAPLYPTVTVCHCSPPYIFVTPNRELVLALNYRWQFVYSSLTQPGKPKTNNFSCTSLPCFAQTFVSGNP